MDRVKPFTKKSTTFFKVFCRAKPFLSSVLTEKCWRIRGNTPRPMSMSATVTTSAPMIVPTADRTKATVLVKVRFATLDPRILPEMSAKVAFLSRPLAAGETASRPAVPATAVTTRNGATVVFVVKNGRAVATPVTPGETMDEAREQARELRLPEHLVELATVAGLCHDVGRFPQYRRYRTFRDGISANHGRLGVEALTRYGGLDWLPPADRHLVRLAVAVHNRKLLPPAVAARQDAAGTLVRIVRDADKLDIVRVIVDYFRHPGPKDPVVFLNLPDIPDRFNPDLITAIDTGSNGRYEAMRSM